MAPEHLAVEPYLLLQGRVDWNDSSGALRGYERQFVARAQALRQLLVQIWWAPAVSCRNCAVTTEVAVADLHVCFKMIVVGPRPQPLYLEPYDEPWG